ncbi:MULTISPECIES: hypothetical protein [unclassified Streptomyces]|uniref:Uncharacterized protein n=1 Tax=Streptomyces millisiae TaxID=3075542 RepID=A0ABU2LRV1_9ACTN|nr:hypothetical protein [Streptomyces sp. DSM 44918]MDT0320240.1 hypothetical protein [Streptomyces sp. DSM 44918]
MRIRSALAVAAITASIFGAAATTTTAHADAIVAIDITKFEDFCNVYGQTWGDFVANKGTEKNYIACSFNELEL